MYNLLLTGIILIQFITEIFFTTIKNSVATTKDILRPKFEHRNLELFDFNGNTQS